MIKKPDHYRCDCRDRRRRADGSLLYKSTLLEGKIQDLLGVFNMAGHMDNFVNGILDIGGVVYYLSVIAICTFLAMQSLQKKRWN